MQMSNTSCWHVAHAFLMKGLVTSTACAWVTRPLLLTLLLQGMGVLDKVVLVFREQDVFWSKSVDFVIMTPNDWSGRW